jgi:hypothetical protein
VTSPWYSFNAPGSFRSVVPSPGKYPEVEDPATLTELVDDARTEIYAAIRRPPSGTSLSDLLRNQRFVSAQGLSRPMPIEVNGNAGMRIEGLRATGTDGAAVGSTSVALRDGRGRTFIVGCRWSRDPDGAREACQQAIESFEPS